MQQETMPEMQVRLIQAGILDLLPRFIGLTLLLILWLVLQATGWLAGWVFQSAWFSVGAAIFGLALLPHWLSALVALAVPACRRLTIDGKGFAYRLGMSAYGADWAQAGAILPTRTLFGGIVLRASGGLRTRSWFWTVLEWPFLLIVWLATIVVATLVNSMAFAAIDFPSRDAYAIPRLFYRRQNLARLRAALEPRLQEA